MLYPQLNFLSVGTPFRSIQTSQPLDPNTTQEKQLSTKDALNLLQSQSKHFIMGKIYDRSYLLTPGDLVTLPRIQQPLGSVLNLSQISQVGSRDFTINGKPFVSNLSIPLTVVEHTRGKLEHKIKFKKRKGYRRAIPSKQPYTRLRVGQINWQS